MKNPSRSLARLADFRLFRLLSSLLLAGLLALSLAGCGYNEIIDRDEQVKASWAEVQNQYKRRADLVPNLVSTVKAAGQFEQDTLTKVVEARSKVAGLKVDASTIDDPEKLKKFEAAQNELSGSLSRLLVVPSNTPRSKPLTAIATCKPSWRARRTASRSRASATSTTWPSTTRSCKSSRPASARRCAGAPCVPPSRPRPAPRTRRK